MIEYQPTVALTQEDMTGAALHGISGFDYLNPTVDVRPQSHLRLVESSGSPTVLDEEWAQRIEEILMKLSNAVSWLNELRAGAETEGILPGVEYPVTLAAPPSQRIQVRGVVAKVTRAPAELALSEAELDGLGWLEGEDE